MTNVRTFGKLIGLLLFCLPLILLISINMYTKNNTRNEARLPCNGNHFSSLLHDWDGIMGKYSDHIGMTEKRGGTRVENGIFPCVRGTRELQ